MTKEEREASLARFQKLLDSPAIRKSIGLDRKASDTNDGDIHPEFNPRMPSPERVDSIIEACRGSL